MNLYTVKNLKAEKKYDPKLFLEKYYFIEDKNFCSNFVEEYYDKKCIIFLETLKKIKKSYKKFSKPWDFKFPFPEA